MRDRISSIPLDIEDPRLDVSPGMCPTLPSRMLEGPQEDYIARSTLCKQFMTPLPGWRPSKARVIQWSRNSLAGERWPYFRYSRGYRPTDGNSKSAIHSGKCLRMLPSHAGPTSSHPERRSSSAARLTLGHGDQRNLKTQPSSGTDE